MHCPQLRLWASGTFLKIQGLRLHASNAGNVGSTPVRELRSYMPWGMAKTQKVKDSVLPLLGARVQSLVRELGSHMPHSQKSRRNDRPWVIIQTSASVRVKMMQSIFYYYNGIKLEIISIKTSEKSL